MVNTSGSLISEFSLPVGLKGRLPVLALLELLLAGVPVVPEMWFVAIVTKCKSTDNYCIYANI